MRLLCVFVCSLLLVACQSTDSGGQKSIPVIENRDKTEIWHFLVRNKQVSSSCKKRHEISIDEVWSKLEQHSGHRFKLKEGAPILPGYLLQNTSSKAQYSFYPSHHACEYERQLVSAYLSDDPQKLTQIASQFTKQDKLAAMTPSNIPGSQKQAWIDAFAGCFHTALSGLNPIKGNLQPLVNSCDCTARELIRLQLAGKSKQVIESKIPEIGASCLSESRL